MILSEEHILLNKLLSMQQSILREETVEHSRTFINEFVIEVFTNPMTIPKIEEIRETGKNLNREAKKNKDLAFAELVNRQKDIALLIEENSPHLDRFKSEMKAPIKRNVSPEGMVANGAELRNLIKNIRMFVQENKFTVPILDTRKLLNPHIMRTLPNHYKYIASKLQRDDTLKTKDWYCLNSLELFYECINFEPHSKAIVTKNKKKQDDNNFIKLAEFLRSSNDQDQIETIQELKVCVQIVMRSIEEYLLDSMLKKHRSVPPKN